MPKYRFGKHAPKLDYRTLRFKSYLTPQIPPPPVSYDVLAAVYKKLGTSDPTTLFPMDGNDSLGDCTIAALAHAITVFNGLVGKNVIMAQQDVVKLYFKLTGGADSGMNELDVLNYWQSNPVAGGQIVAYAKIDVKNHTHIQQAIKISMRAGLGRPGR
jgi:hypothetical protein